MPTETSATYRQALSGSVMISLAAAASGALLSFLFAVPRYVTAKETGDTKNPAVRLNNNFQEISDWLTKIIVGIGLVQSRPIIGHLSEMVVWIGNAIKLPPGYVACVMALYAVCGFLIGYVWTVQSYARREIEYLERQFRIAYRTLVTEATSALDSPDTSRSDLDFWYGRLAAGIQERASDAKIAVAKARYEAETYMDLNKAKATLDGFLTMARRSGMRGTGDYADGLFWLASYEVRQIDETQKAVPRSDAKYASALEKLEEAVPIRPDAKSWLKTDSDLGVLTGLPRFEKLF